MPKVSILLPALSPDYVDLCIASCLAQSFQDFELLISDDSEDERVASVVSKWSDSRIRYGKNPRRQEMGTNRDRLLRLATGKYVKFLHHDDYLHPRSLELLVATSESTQAAISFHGRYLVDVAGRIIAQNMAVPPASVILYGKAEIVAGMLPTRNNFIGEPSNILIDADVFENIDAAYSVGGRKLRFLEDVALYINTVMSGRKLVGCGWYQSSFRVHPAQNSMPSSAMFSAGLFEWEYLNRWAIDQGLLRPDHLPQLSGDLRRLYLQYESSYPELTRFAAIDPAPEGGRYLTPAFLDAIESGWREVEHRQVSRRRGEHDARSRADLSGSSSN